jgi:timeless
LVDLLIYPDLQINYLAKIIPLFQEPEDRMEDDKLLTERILILIRNILDIPITPEDEKRTDDDASVHDQV